MFKIYVGNLDYKVKVEQLRELFSVFAPIEDLVIPTDPVTNKAKGFAIVMIRDPELGHAAVKAMQGKRLMGRTLVVNEAVKKKKGLPAPMSKADLVRNGPFGPRLNRFGDQRQPGTRTNRNPRRGGLPVRGGPPAGASPVPPTTAPRAATPVSPPQASPPGPVSAGQPRSPAALPQSASGQSANSKQPVPRPIAVPGGPPRPAAAPLGAPPRPADATSAVSEQPSAAGPTSGGPIAERPKAQRLAAAKRPSTAQAGTPPAGGANEPPANPGTGQS